MTPIVTATQDFMNYGRCFDQGVTCQLLPTGWVQVAPNQGMVERAKHDRDQRDARYGEGSWVADREKRWAGELGEQALAWWLKLMAEPYEHFGGTDEWADFYVGGQSVGVKTRVRDRMYADANVIIPEQHIDHDEEWWFFTCLVSRPDRVLLLGATQSDYFRENSKRYARGDVMPGGGGKASNPCALLNVQHLQHPMAWIGLPSFKPRLAREGIHG